MKKRLLFRSLICLLLSAPLAQCQQLTIPTESGKQTVLTRSDIESLPHVKVATHGSEISATFEGVALRAVLEKAAVEFGHSVIPCGGSVWLPVFWWKLQMATAP
jgi:hypothetical protein